MGGRGFQWKESLGCGRVRREGAVGGKEGEGWPLQEERHWKS